MSRSSAKSNRFALCNSFLALLFMVTICSQVWVQLIARPAMLKMASGLSRLVVTRVDYAKRGNIISSDGTLLAQSVDRYELGLQFSKIPKSPAFFMALGHASGIAASEMMQVAYSGKSSRFWRDRLTSDQAQKIQDVKMTWRADGVSISRSMHRSYPLAESASGIVGGVKDSAPVAGLELSQDNLLTGRNGFKEGMIDRTGAFLPMRMTGRTAERIDGTDITLSLDASLQADAARLIKRAVQVNKADSGAAIIMDPKTGDILAMANWPSFNPEADPVVPTANSAYMGVYEPGSTFKILTLAKGLDEGLINPAGHLYCGGALRVGGVSVRCDSHHGKRAHGAIDAESAITKSCNVSAASWALRIGYRPMVEYLDKLGLTSKVDLGLNGEAHAVFRRDEVAKQLQLATVGFGQSMSASPISLASAFSVLANGGERMRPRLIKAVGAKEVPVQSLGRVIKSEVAKQAIELMVNVIGSDEGTGARLRIPGYRIAGKTGTAEKRGSRTGGYVANFVGYVPADDPRAVVLVMVDNPRKQYYGSAVAGPVFRELALRVIQRYAIPRDGKVR